MFNSRMINAHSFISNHIKIKSDHHTTETNDLQLEVCDVQLSEPAIEAHSDISQLPDANTPGWCLLFNSLNSDENI